MADTKAETLSKAHDKFDDAKKDELSKDGAYDKALRKLREKEEALAKQPSDANRDARDKAKTKCDKAQRDYEDAAAARKKAAEAYDAALRARWDERVEEADGDQAKKDVRHRELDAATREHDLKAARRKLRDLERDLEREDDPERRARLRERIDEAKRAVDRAADEEKRTDDNRKYLGGK